MTQRPNQGSDLAIRETVIARPNHDLLSRNPQVDGVRETIGTLRADPVARSDWLWTLRPLQSGTQKDSTTTLTTMCAGRGRPPFVRRYTDTIIVLDR